MKRLVVLFVVAGSGGEGWPQGQIVFNNRVLNAVVAPVYDVEPADPSLAKHGNTHAGTPPGTQTYTGMPLAGPGFTAQLFAGPTHAAPDHLRPLLPTTTFRTGEGAGFIVPPGAALLVPGVVPGEHALVRLCVWHNPDGAVSNWLQVLANPALPRGQSSPFRTRDPLGGLFVPPPNLVGLESFNLTTGLVQRSGLRVNFQPASFAVPAGYRSDVGLPYGDRGSGFEYGWNVDNTAQTLNRNAPHSPDPRFDSFTLMGQNPGLVWEAGVRAGIYRVYLVTGDPLSLDGVYGLEVEGVQALSGRPVPGNPWVEGEVVVEVADGRLTVTSATGSLSNRICFVEIDPVVPPRLDSLKHPDLDSSGLHLRFAGVPGVHYQVQASSNLLTWWVLGTPNQTSEDRFEFLDGTLLGTLRRFYRAQILTSPQAQGSPVQ